MFARPTGTNSMRNTSMAQGSGRGGATLRAVSGRGRRGGRRKGDDFKDGDDMFN
jgi:hypothetical protein